MSPPELPPFAQKLKAAREAAGITQAQLAELSGLHLGAVFKLEQGKREPSWATVQALAKALDVDCRAFAVEDESPPKKAAPKRKGKK
jgi:transcriptional regulator with XRE-family HTH domain